MMNRYKIFATALTVAVGVASSALAQAKDVTVQLGWLPNAAYAGEIVALEKGYFADVGLNVDILPGGPAANPIQELMGGSAEVVIGYAPQIMYSVNKGLPLKSFAASFQKAPLTFYSLGEKNITSVADWKGKRVGAAPSSKPQVAALLAEVGLTLDDISFIQAGIPALMQDQVDIQGTWPTNLAAIAPILDHPGGHNTQSIWDNGLQFQSNYYTATTATLESDPEMLTAFLTAVDKGWAWVADNQDETIEILVGYAPALQADREGPALAVIVDEYIYTAETATDGFGNVSADRWQQTLDTYAGLGEISPDLSAEDVHTNAILDAVERTYRD